MRKQKNERKKNGPKKHTSVRSGRNHTKRFLKNINVDLNHIRKTLGISFAHNGKVYEPSFTD